MECCVCRVNGQKTVVKDLLGHLKRFHDIELSFHDLEKAIESWYERNSENGEEI